MDYDPLFHIVLWQPEIPNNTGNIGRTCLGLQAKLHLIGPLGFDISDKAVKRAGLDYWPYLKKSIHTSWEEFLESEPEGRKFLVTTKSDMLCFTPKYQKNDYFIFGRETKGLPDAILDLYPEQKIRIPMLGPTRSLNVANAVSIVGYEFVRQKLM
jgi:tRNA (cytidine/uridine-2'-O-)-methyltransferase